MLDQSISSYRSPQTTTLHISSHNLYTLLNSMPSRGQTSLIHGSLARYIFGSHVLGLSWHRLLAWLVLWLNKFDASVATPNKLANDVPEVKHPAHCPERSAV